MVHRPMVGLALTYIAGTALGLHAVRFSLPALALGIGFLLLGVAMSWLAARQRSPRWTGWATCALHVATCLLSMTAATPVLLGITAAAPLHAASDSRGDAIGVVVDEPDILPGDGTRLNSWRVPFRIEQWRWGEDRDWTGVNRPCVVWWKAPPGVRLPQYGERWRLREVAWPAMRGRSSSPLNRFATLRLYSRQADYLAAGYGSAVRTWCYTARQRAAEHLVRGIERFEEACGIHQAIMLGYRQRLTDRVEELGAATGTLHIIAISGSHVAIIALMCIFMFRTVGLSRERWIYLLAPLLVAYTIATGAQASAIRACVMALACFFAPALGRRPDVVSALAFAAIAILVVDPGQLVDVGFVLSFVVVTGLIAMYPLFLVRLNVWPRDALAMGPDTAFERLLREGANAVLSLMALSIAAWIASAPLTAYYFERFTPISLVANLVVVPLAFLMVLAGCLSLVAGSCIGLLGEFFNHAACLLIQGYMWITELLTRVPYANMPVSRPPLWTMALYYAGVAVLAAAAWSRRQRTVAAETTDGGS